MTTASPIAFPTMEVPTVDDTMEMASPLPGHDDFEIDLDVMEDQTSNADKDMMGDDGYADDAVDIDYQRDGANDADMMDDAAEPTMVDAEDQYPETNDNEMQYAAEEPFEAEMEDEYEEDNDVPMPKINEPGPITLQEENVSKAEGAVEPAESNGVTEEIKDTQPPSQEPLQEPKDEHAVEAIEVSHEDVEQRDDPDPEKVAEESGLDQQQPESSENEISATNKAELEESHPAQPDAGEVDQKDLKPAEEKDETAETQPPVDHPEPQQIAPPEEKVTHVSKDEEQRTNADHRTGLHPVKVYYQDNEISLFPPREGDASETYFLGDESLAYEDFGKLFESFRGVLQEHIGENEVLVVDIDSMNIQLTEDSLHISKVTLHQFVNLYLHLCDNESIGEPEALYLSLSTRLTIPAAISDLTAAANEGKGISEIFPWDDYEEVEQSKDPAAVQPNEPVQDVSGSTQPQEQGSQEPQESHVSHEHEEHNEQETPVPTGSGVPRVEEPETAEKHGEAERENTHGKEEPEVPIAAGEDAVRSEECHHESQQGDSNETEQVANDEQKDLALEDENLASGDHDDDVSPTAERKDDEYEGEYEEGEYEDELQEYNEPELEEEHAHPINDQSFESEEQKTESTATITPLPAQDVTGNQQDTDSSVGAPQEGHDDHDDYHEIEGTGTGEEPNAETNPDALEYAEYVEDLEYNDNAADYAFDVEPGENAEKAHEEPLSESHGPGQNGENEQDHASQQDATDEALQNGFEGILHEQSESEVEDAVPDVAEGNVQGTAKPGGDLVGIAEDLAENPTENAQGINSDNEDLGHGDSGEGWIEIGDVSSANAKDAVKDVTFGGDDDEYFNLDFDAEFGNPEESGISEAVAPEHVSTKRIREPEDETELTETSTPDVKRPRSS